MNHPFRTLAAGLAACALFILIGCLLDDKHAGRRGSEVENEVYGVLVTRDGSTVAGARVRALPQDTGGARIADSVLTDGEGRYSFRGLPSGTYNLLGDYESGALVVLIRGVEHADTLGRDSVGVDTLRAPGRIRGRLLLGDRGFGGALAYLPGTSYLAVSDDSGRFLVTGIPQGRYSVKYSAAGYLIEPDTGIFLPSAATVELPVKRLAVDPAYPPPAPQGLKAAFDTLLGRASLAWHPVDVSDLDGYLVYRDAPGEAVPLLVAGGFTRDTVFVDSSLGAPGSIMDGPILYRVKARDRGANASLTFSAPAVAPAAPVDSIETGITWIGPVGDPDTIALGDTIRVRAEFSNPTRLNRWLTWSQSGRSDALSVRGVDALAGRDSVAWVAKTLGNWDLTLSALDAGGSVWSRTRSFRVMGNSLRAVAGPDTTVSLGDSVILAGAAESRFGRYVRWEWDVGGTGRFIQAGPGRWGARAPRSVGSHPCILRVTDAFGDTALDTTWLRVAADVPSVTAKGDTTVSLGDSVRVSASAIDGYGQVVKWEWKVCPDTAFKAGEASMYLVMPRSAQPACAVIARATDDDGQQAMDTVRVRIVVDAPTATAAGDTTVSLGDSVRVAASGSDGYGRIVKWEWKIGAAGAYRETSMSATLEMPRIAGAGQAVILRVTDDDGQTATDTVNVNIIADPPRAEAIGSGTVSLNDSLKLEGRGTDVYGRITGYEWACGFSAPFLKASAGIWFGTAPPVAGASVPCILRVTDDDGQTGLDTVFFTVLRDAPFADVSAGKASGFPGDEVGLLSRSTDKYGKIVRWEWDIGATGTFRQGRSDTTIVLPAAVGPHRCVLRVTDDDGQSSLDTATIQVSLSTRMSAGADTTVAAGGMVSLHGMVYSDFGPVSKWEWDIGATGAFKRTSQGDTAFRIPFDKQSFRCVLRVTNASGATGMDTVAITVGPIGDLVWDRFDLPAGVGARSGTMAVPFQGKLWIFGGATDKTMNDIWSSDDGIAWTLRGTAAWKPRYKHRVIEFAGKLWMLGGSEILDGKTGTSEVWSSANGLLWTKSTATTPFTPRFGHQAVIYKNQMCVIGGYDFNGGQINHSDLWCSANGTAWSAQSNIGSAQYSENSWATVSPDGSLITVTQWMSRWTSTTDGSNWLKSDLDPGGDFFYATSLYMIAGEMWMLGQKFGVAGGRILCSVPAAGSPITRPAGTPLEGFQDPNGGELVEFRGLPWIFAGPVIEAGVTKTRIFRLRR